MSTSATRPRPSQISELTRGLGLPLPEVPTDHLEIIAERLHRAYHDLLTRHPKEVTSGNEAEVTALMETRLIELINQDPLWGCLVRFVARGKESLSFDGSHLEKRPDLSICLTNHDFHFPLIVEAKIIDSANGKTEKLYCENGLRRFIKGDYAWGTQEAFMMAYVRDSSSIELKLTPFLLKATKKNPSIYLVEELPSSLESNGIDLARSRHGRVFTYTHQTPPLEQPGPIVLWHLWLI